MLYKLPLSKAAKKKLKKKLNVLKIIQLIIAKSSFKFKYSSAKCSNLIYAPIFIIPKVLDSQNWRVYELERCFTDYFVHPSFFKQLNV